MKEFEEYENKIAKYLEGNMSDEEEEMFMQELNDNAALRKQYEEELLVSALLSNEDKKVESIQDSSFHKKDDNLKGRKHNVRNVPFPAFTTGYKYIAAATLVIAISVSVFFITQNKNVQHPVVAESNNKKNAPANTDSSLNTQPYSKNDDSLAESLFNEYYTGYTSKNDPAEISNYYSYYQNKQYDKVIHAQKSGYEVMGTDNRQQVLNQYMLLYKGLAYLETNNIKNAIKSFDSVLKTSGKNSSIYYNAEWYCTLSYLKENNITKADSVLDNILQSASPYKNQATQIIERLK